MKFIKCFSIEECNELEKLGYTKLFDNNGVYMFSNDNKITTNFSDNEILNKVKFTNTLNF